MKNKIIKITLLLLIISFSWLGLLNISKTLADSPDTIYVPDDYSTIQAAVDAANSGDTIIVRDGTYIENINVNKAHLTIKSENGAEKTIVQAPLATILPIVEVISNFTTISGFMVKGGGGVGIQLYEVDYSNISNNNSTDNATGIYLHNSTNNNISNNICSGNNGIGVYLYESYNNTIKDNKMSDGFFGVDIDWSDSNSITNNNISNNWCAISLDLSADNNALLNNNVSNNSYIITAATSANDNNLYFNNFIDNIQISYNYYGTNIWNSPEQISYAYNNKNYTNYLGNYWDDYTGLDNGTGGRTVGDGVGDTDIPYSTNGDGDDYPLMQPFENYINQSVSDLNWESKTPMPTPRSWTDAVIYNGKIYVVGGCSCLSGYKQFHNAVATLEVYDPFIDSWTSLHSMSIPRVGPAATVVDGKIYVMGGFNRDTWSANSAVEIYDIATDIWTIGTPMPTPRSWLKAVVLDGKIYALGGVGHGYRNDCEMYDPATDIWTPCASFKTGRYLHAVATANGKIYVIGGDNWKDGHDVYSDIQEYSPLTDSWTIKTSMSTAINNIDAITVNNKIWVFGGEGLCRVYDIGTDQWEEKISNHNPTSSFSVEYLDGIVYRFGGGGWGPTLDLVESVDIETILENQPPVIIANPIYGIPDDFTFEEDYDGNGVSVRYLQIILNSNSKTRVVDAGAQTSCWIPEYIGGAAGCETEIFGPATKDAVVRFQEEHKEEILIPVGLIYGTGYVGDGTKAQLDKILLAGLNSRKASGEVLLDENERKAEVINYFRKFDSDGDGYFDEDYEYEPFRGFPVVLVLALISAETGAIYDFNNEWTRVNKKIFSDKKLKNYGEPKDFGRGLMQITSKKKVGNDDCDSDPDCYNCKNYLNFNEYPCSKYYSNTKEGIANNLRDGLEALQSKYTDAIYDYNTLKYRYDYCVKCKYCSNKGGECPESCEETPSGGKLSDDNPIHKSWSKCLDLKFGISCDEMKWISLLQRYNGFSRYAYDSETEYLLKIKNKLKYLEGTFSELSENEIKTLSSTTEIIEKVWNSTNKIRIFSPVELRVYDAEDKIAGLVDGQIKEEIFYSSYNKNLHELVIYFADSDYRYEIVGTDTGIYGLSIISVVNGEEIIFTATDIPTTPNEVHQYSIDWEALSYGEEGVTLQIDEDGDGEFDETINSGKNLDMGTKLETQIAVTEMSYDETDILNNVTQDVGDGIAPLLLSELKESSVDLENYTPDGKLNPGQKKKLKMKFKFLETAGNEYQGKSINVNFNFLAKQ